MMPGKSGKLCTDIILESILRSSTDTAIAATDLDFHILYYNPMAEKLFGYKAGEVIGKTVMEIHTKEKVEPYRFEKAIETVRKEGEYRYTVEQKNENGSRILDSRVSGIWDRQTNLIGFVLMSRDITGRIKAEEELHIQRDLGIAIGNVSNLKEALILVVDAVTRLESIDCCGIYLVDPESGAVDLVHSKGLSQDFIKEVSHYDKNTESAHLIMKKQPVFMEYSKLKVSKTDIQYLEGLRAIAIIPVVHHGRVIACMNIASRTHKSISGSAQNALEAIASQVGTIIARLMAEEALQKSSDHFRSVVQTATDAIISIDRRGKVIFWSNSAEAVFGYSANEAIGKQLNLIIPERLLEAHRKGLNRTISKGETKTIGKTVELTGLRKGGREFPLELSLASWNKENEVFFTGIIRDITGRKHAEKALLEREHMLQSILRSAPIGVGLVSNRVLKWTNEKLCKMIGYSCKEMIDKSARILYLCDEDYEYVGREKYAQIRERGTGTVETHWQRKDGKVIDVLLSSTPLNPDDLSAGVIFTSLDITDRVNAEREQKRLNIELLQKNKELEQVVYVSSHDLRTPLVNIEGYSGEIGKSLKDIISILDNEGLSPEIKERLAPLIKDSRESMDYVSKGVSKMESLLNGLLQFSRSGRVEIKKEELDMNMLISAILNSFKFQVKENGTKIEISELPSCHGDERQINQLYTNLIGNAFKYCDPDRPCILKISGQKDNTHSVYCVEDNGIGIAPEYHEKIFEIFHQLNPGKGGEGLGLSIVHKIVERHNGRIWVESEPDRGSRFYVSL